MKTKEQKTIRLIISASFILCAMLVTSAFQFQTPDICYSCGDPFEPGYRCDENTGEMGMNMGCTGTHIGGGYYTCHLYEGEACNVIE